MPRSFDSDDRDPTLTFTENVECPACGEISEGEFHDESASLSVQDMTDPPVGNHVCPRCGAPWRTELTGWMFYSEAG